MLYRTNKSLKEIAKMVGLSIPLTLYVARHSWASIAKSKNIPIPVISEGMFFGCSSLAGLANLPEGIKTIGKNAFKECSSFAEITIPATVTTIGEMSFNYAHMKNVYLPEGLKTIETLGFFEIPLLENVYSYKTDSLVEDSHYVSDEALGTVYNSLPEGLEYIGSDAFSYNRELKYMYIPASVEYIGHNAFWDTVYKDGKELKGVVKMEVALSEEEFEQKVEAGNNWCPKYDYLLFKKSIDIIYNSNRAAK